MRSTTAPWWLITMTAALLTSWGVVIANPIGERVKSADGTVSIVVPPDWKVDPSPGRPGAKMVMYSPMESANDPLSEMILVNADILQNWHTIDYYIIATTAPLKKQYGHLLVSDTQAMIDGMAARRIVAKMNMQGHGVMSITYFVRVKNVAYTINALSLQSSFERWQQMLDELCLTVKFPTPTKP